MPFEIKLIVYNSMYIIANFFTSIIEYLKRDHDKEARYSKIPKTKVVSIYQEVMKHVMFRNKPRPKINPLGVKKGQKNFN